MIIVQTQAIRFVATFGPRLDPSFLDVFLAAESEFLGFSAEKVGHKKTSKQVKTYIKTLIFLFRYFFLLIPF